MSEVVIFYLLSNCSGIASVFVHDFDQKNFTFTNQIIIIIKNGFT